MMEDGVCVCESLWIREDPLGTGGFSLSLGARTWRKKNKQSFDFLSLYAIERILGCRSLESRSDVVKI